MKRRTFVRISVFVALTPFLWIWYRITSYYNLNISSESSVMHIKNIKEGISFYDELIVCRIKNEIKVYSSKCTHAGCRITKSEGSNIICGCHGSRFESSTGKVTKGPALENLRQLPFFFNQKNESLQISMH